MGIIQDFMHFFYHKNLIRHSKIKKIFTKYGIFQVKIYKDGHHEFLVIMSRDFFELETPIVYSYSESNDCDVAEHTMCYCNHQIDVALKMIRSTGGAIIYYSADVRNIDGLLKELHVGKVDTVDDVMRKAKVNSELKMYEREFRSIGFIFENLAFSRMKLITHDINVVHVSQKLNIKVVERASMISFDYGGKAKY